jgi:hypothetical protein
MKQIPYSFLKQKKGFNEKQIICKGIESFYFLYNCLHLKRSGY